MQNKYWILWFYLAGNGKILLSADNAEHAAELVLAELPDDFAKTGTIYVFDHDPALVIVKGEKTDRSAQLLSPGEWSNDTGPKGWYAVSTKEAGGIIAYAETEELAEAIIGLLMSDPSLRKGSP